MTQIHNEAINKSLRPLIRFFTHLFFFCSSWKICRTLFSFLSWFSIKWSVYTFNDKMDFSFYSYSAFNLCASFHTTLLHGFVSLIQGIRSFKCKPTKTSTTYSADINFNGFVHFILLCRLRCVNEDVQLCDIVKTEWIIVKVKRLKKLKYSTVTKTMT